MSSSPVVVDLGKHKRKAVKKLVKGEGPLVSEVESVIQDLKASGAVGENAQPVVIVVRQKARKSKNGMGWMVGR